MFQLDRAKVTINTIQKLYKSKEPITVLTAHDYPTGLFVEKAGIEICLVGDSLGMVALGYQNTSPITMEVLYLILLVKIFFLISI